MGGGPDRESCAMFCPPQGRFIRDHVDMTRDAGFVGLRTTELASLAAPQGDKGLAVMPTSVQAHRHGAGAYVRNALKRRSPGTLLRIAMAPLSDWSRLAAHLLNAAAEKAASFIISGAFLGDRGAWRMAPASTMFSP